MVFLMEATKVGVLVTVLIFVLGLGMYVLEGQYSGALTVSGQNRCEETETLFPTPAGDLETKQSIFLKGGTKTKVGSAAWSSITQESCSGNILTERYCTSTATAASETLTCDNGCANGKCNPPTCTDNDLTNYTLASTTTGLYTYDTDALGVPPATQSAKTYSDICTSNTMLKEYKCNSVSNFVVFEQKNCVTLGAGYTCDNGACIAPTLAGQTCFGDGTNDCFSSYDDSDCDGIIDDDTVCAPYACVDTDPSNDAFLGGVVTITSADGQTKTHPDDCGQGKTIFQVNCPPSTSSTFTSTSSSCSKKCKTNSVSGAVCS